MPLFPLEPRMGTTPTPAFTRRRLVLFGGGGLLLAVLLAVQGALERAATPLPSATPTVGTPEGTEGLPDYGSFASPAGLETPWWLITSGLALKLVVVLLLIYGTIWLLRRYLGRPVGAPAAPGSATLLQTLPLGQQQMVHLVQVGDRVLVLGATARQVTLLTEIADAATIGELRLSTGRGGPAGEAPFGERLAAAAGEVAPPPAPTPAAPPASPAPSTSADGPSAAGRGTLTPATERPATALTPSQEERQVDSARRLAPWAGRSAPPSSTDIQMALRAGREAVQRQIAALRDGTARPDDR